MSALAEVVAAATVAGGTRLVAGTAVRGQAGGVEVAVQGRRVTARWLDTAAARVGQPVLVALTGAGVGQSSAIVLGRLGAAPRPVVGVVRTVLAATAEVEAGGMKLTCAWVGAAAPAVGDQVRLLWQGDEATILGTVGSAAADDDDGLGGVPSPSQSLAEAASGTSVLRATAAGSWTARGRWSSAVVQGSGAGVEDSRGGWGYGAALRALAGARVVEAWVRVTGRAVSGAPAAPLTLRLACHAQTDLLTRPEPAGGDGWEAVVPGRGAAWPLDVPIPVERAQWLIDHAGGLMVGGGHYGGVAGLDSDPTSGQITITWKKEEQ